MNYQKLTYESREFNIWILVSQEGFEEQEAKRIVLMEELKMVIGKRACKAEGHKIVVDANIGPNSGSEDLFCIRCGYAERINYY